MGPTLRKAKGKVEQALLRIHFIFVRILDRPWKNRSGSRSQTFLSDLLFFLNKKRICLLFLDEPFSFDSLTFLTVHLGFERNRHFSVFGWYFAPWFRFSADSHIFCWSGSRKPKCCGSKGSWFQAPWNLALIARTGFLVLITAAFNEIRAESTPSQSDNNLDSGTKRKLIELKYILRKLFEICKKLLIKSMTSQVQFKTIQDRVKTTSKKVDTLKKMQRSSLIWRLTSILGLKLKN